MGKLVNGAGRIARLFLFLAIVADVSAQSADEQAIRAVRAKSNAAIAAHDAAAMARAWTDDFVSVSSTSAHTSGRPLNQNRMAKQFADHPDTIYVRTPKTIEVYAPWNVASERGEWTGGWTEPDGTFEIGGTYQAQWRKIDGEWLIRSELFVPTHCRGSKYCAQRP